MNAIIEIGTNSLKLLIYRLLNRSFEAVFDKTVITRLSENYNQDRGRSVFQALKHNIQEIKRMYRSYYPKL